MRSYVGVLLHTLHVVATHFRNRHARPTTKKTNRTDIADSCARQRPDFARHQPEASFARAHQLVRRRLDLRHRRFVFYAFYRQHPGRARLPANHQAPERHDASRHCPRCNARHCRGKNPAARAGSRCGNSCCTCTSNRRAHQNRRRHTRPRAHLPPRRRPRSRPRRHVA